MILVIDNFDSYTNNLVLLIQSLTGTRPTVRDNRTPLADIVALKPSAIVLSAGPGNPQTAGGVCREVIETFTSTPILGVCLGHQLIALHFGGAVSRLAEPRHGTTVAVQHQNIGLFAGLPQAFHAMRYHSLTVSAPPTLLQTAHGDGEILALQHPTRPLYGVQFHPESIASQHGREIMAAFLGLRFEALAETSLPADESLLHEALFGDASASFLVRHPDRYTFIGTGTEGRALARAVSAGYPFGTGLVGVVSYEGEERFLQVDRCLVIDGDRVLALASGASLAEAQRNANEWKETLERIPLVSRANTGSSTGQFKVSRDAYMDKIAQCFELIRAGECYELCLTNRFSGSTTFNAWAIYRRLAHENPAPYRALIRFTDKALIMSSPERLVRVSNGVAETRPIKGTRARSEPPETLANSEKDRRENLMIVDVSRHDLGQVSNAVEVTELLKVEAHPTVWQLVSTIRARLAGSAAQAVTALMPPASMTGAPKARAVELLASLEASPRGFYSGAAGYLSASGDADFAVVIRSMLLEGERVSFGVGGAIVLGSDPEDEWAEVMLKAKALLAALSIANLPEPQQHG